VSVPGVNSWALALADLQELLPNGGRVVIAFDTDWREKLPVHQSMWNLALASEALGFTVEIATWDSGSKGLDDLLAMGRRPKLKSVAELPSPYWIPKVRSRRLADSPPRRATTTMNLEEMRARFQTGTAPLRRCA
jgi:hypothetical protein